MKPNNATTPTADLVHRISAWYERETGQRASQATRGRILEVLLYLERTGLQIQDCTLHIATDERWHERGNRVGGELQAAPIGRTQTRGKKPQHVFIHPKNRTEDTANGHSRA